MWGRGRGFGWHAGWYGYGWSAWPNWHGNPYPFCRRFPWLPRGWWRMPYWPMYSYPYSMPWIYPYYSYYPPWHRLYSYYWYPYW